MGKFDALALEVDKPSRMTIIDPVSGQPLKTKPKTPGESPQEAFIEVYSGDSKIAREHYRQTGQKRLDAMARRRKRIAGSIEEIEASDLDLLVKLTAGWFLVAPDGEPVDVPFTAENARELYAEPGMAWLRDQVDEFAGERANFSKASPKN